MPHFIALAYADLPVAGSVRGSFLDTQTPDFNYERITETESGGRPANRYSFLEHKWTIDITGGSEPVFFFKGYRSSSSDADEFHLKYSLNNVSYLRMLTVGDISDDLSYEIFRLPLGTTGRVYIRVTDTDQTPGNRVADSIYLDHMGIASVGTPTPGITVSRTSGLVTTESGGTDTFTVVLDTQPTALVTVDVSTSDATEGLVETVLEGPAPLVSLEFGIGDWSVPQTVTVTGQPDGIPDPDVEYTLVTAPAMGGDYAGVDAADVSATNLDIDTPPVNVDSLMPQEITADAPPVAVSIGGSGFQANAKVSFENGTGPTPVINELMVMSDMHIAVMMSVATSKGPKRRSWDVRVTNPDGSTGVLPGGLTVVK